MMGWNANGWRRALAVACIAGSMIGCSRTKTPPAIATAPAQPKVSYAQDVHPILMKSCVQCHSRGKFEGEFSIDTREAFLKGGWSGPAVIEGKSEESYLMKLVTVGDGGKIMPMRGPKLTPDEVDVLKRWIDEGLVWDMEKEGRDKPLAPLPPRRVQLPPIADAGANPIDAILESYYKEHDVRRAKPISDAAYARRAYLDVLGLLPPAEELSAFVADRSRDKRERLADRLLADNRAYAEHWITFWNDMLRNDFTGTGYIDGGRKQITSWLYESLATNKPYDQFVRELISPTAASEGFIKGIVWRGVTNASQTPPMQAAQNISQVFMGTNLKCASCHDSFINSWKLKDAYGLAAIFSDEPLELVRCDAPTGEMAEMHFIFPELGQIDPALARADRMEQLAGIITKKENGRLTRTIVNRLWARFFGRGLIEPVDNMDAEPWNADVLDWLAWDLADNGYDLKRTIRWMITSEAYQRPAVSVGENASKDYVFAGPAVRRLTAEQMLDAFGGLTGVWQDQAAAKIDFAIGSPEAATSIESVREWLGGARWIWDEAGAQTNAPKGTVYFRKAFDLPASVDDIEQAIAVLACDNLLALFVNGNKIAESKDWNRPVSVDLRKHLVPGRNVIAVQATNTADGPAGLIAHVRIEAKQEVINFRSDASWICTSMKLDGWEKSDFIPFEWASAVEIGELTAAPWNIADSFAESVRFAADSNAAEIRAWLAKSDPFMRTLGRPNRDVVVTTRPSVATTLEALELTNGPTLASKLEQAALNILEAAPERPRALVDDLYLRALGRKPTREERKIATGLVGEELTPEGVEDFLWALVMLPEFQLIY